MLFSRSLKARLVLYGVSLFTIVGGSIIAASAYSSYKQIKAQAMTAASESARDYSVIISQFVNNALQTSLMVSGMIQGGHQTGQLTRDMVGHLIPGMVEQNKNILGITIGYEPNAFDGRDEEFKGHRSFSEDTGRFAPYFYRSKDGTVNFDDSSATTEGDPEDLEWYDKPLKSNASTLTPPYLYPIDNVPTLMVTASVMLYGDNNDRSKPVGVIATDITLDQLQKVLSAYKPLGVGTVTLLSHDKTWVANPNAEKIGKPETDANILGLSTTADSEGIASGMESSATGDKFLTFAVPVKFLEAKQVWTVFVTVPASYITNLVSQSVKIQAIIGLALISFGAFIFFLVGGQFVNPITAITAMMKRVSNNELDVEIPYTERADEIGYMAQSLQTFRDNMRESNELRAAQERQKKQSEVDRQVMMQKVANDFERDVKSIVNAVSAAASELAMKAQEMENSVVEGARLASSATSAANETSGNVQTVAAAAEELSASVREISGQLQRTSAMVQQSSDKAQNADHLAKALSQASDKVNDVMEIISGIASQINLLALNATIESARAGEAGKGFAVVASEVKNLAGQTDQSVTGIRTIVDEMRAASQNIAVALSDIKESVGDISGAAANVAAAVEEQSATTNEIARNMQNAAQGTQLISRNMGDVSTTSDTARQSASRMLESARGLTEQATTLNAQVDGFLAKIRQG